MMVRLRDRTDSLDDPLPTIPLIGAIEDISVRGPTEKRIAGIPGVHRRRFEVCANVLGQPLGQNIPALAAVPAAGNARVGGVQFSPSARAGLRAGNKHQLPIARMNEQRVDISDPEIPRRQTRPTLAAVLANADASDIRRPTVSGGHDEINFSRIRSGNQYPVRVRVQPRNRLPAFPSVFAFEEAAYFDRRIKGVGAARVKGETLDVRLVWRAGKSPLLNSGHLTQARKLTPVLSQIVTIKEVRRLGSGIKPGPSSHLLRRQRVDLRFPYTAIAAFPVLAQILAGIETRAIGAGKEHPARGLVDDRAYMLARKLRLLRAPRVAVTHKRKNSIDGAHQKLVPW